MSMKEKAQFFPKNTKLKALESVDRSWEKTTVVKLDADEIVKYIGRIL